MFEGFGDTARPVDRVRAADGRRFLSAVSALTALLLALTAVVWTAAAGEDPGTPGPTADEARASSTDTAGEPSGGTAADALGEFGRSLRPSGQDALLANPLYGTGRLSPLPCPAPEPDVDAPEEMAEFLHAVTDCLDDAWATQFARAGLPFEPPERVFWSEPGTSPCRAYPSAAGAFYCRADTGVYIGVSDVVDKWHGTSESVVYASLLAHEYAHHVQGESGLLEYYHEQRRLEDDVSDRNAWTRRSELQANCLAGVFLGSVRVSYPLDEGDLATLLADAAATADRADGAEEDRTHGSVDNSVRWTRTGWEQQTPGACNTWAEEDGSLVG
ncbi:neutral zinc metallopeptidase [Nocardiopsis sp. CNT312]|uniref:neutral zinc metallopeptidase n=1 Tax=Nocardiopsis sp. CNT312 TaxID=1137268 RepID=UPI00048EA0AA|nr:neutral zinc metallopeptidase [Nocardiopsis sp. CNT312]